MEKFLKSNKIRTTLHHIEFLTQFLSILVGVSGRISTKHPLAEIRFVDLNERFSSL